MRGTGEIVPMIQTVEAVVDKEGRVRLLEKVRLPEARRALVPFWKRIRE